METSVRSTARKRCGTAFLTGLPTAGLFHQRFDVRGHPLRFRAGAKEGSRSFQKEVSSRSAVTTSLLSRHLVSRRRRAQLAELNRAHRDDNRSLLKRTGMNMHMVLSNEMQKFLGHDMMTRGQVIAALTKYIKENGLQLKEDRRRFIVNGALSKLLGVSGPVAVLDLQRLISNHLSKPADVSPQYEERSLRMFEAYARERGAVDSKKASRRVDPRGRNSRRRQAELRSRNEGMYSDIVIDPCLRVICGGKSRMSRPQVVKAVWDYIKRNELQVPGNRRFIAVDSGLKEGLRITDTDKIDCFHIGRYLWKLCKKPGPQD